MLDARIRKAFPATSVLAARANDETAARDGDGDSPRIADAASAHGDGRAGGRFTLDVDFNAPPGVTILFGASGAGKTQTLKAIAGLVRPDAGLIAVDGQTLFDSSRGVDVATFAP